MQLAFDLFGAPPLAEVHARLLSRYGPRRDGKRLEPMDRLVDAILSSRTYDGVSSTVFAQLKRRFPRWEDLMIRPVEEVHTLIKTVTFAEDKAPTLIAALRTIHAHAGDLTLSFLRDMTPSDAMAWLEEIRGVGRKISAAVLNFSTLRGHALVIDTHVLRISQRLGWISRGANTADKAYEPLMARVPETWGADDLYEFHWLVKELGQNICTHDRPLCTRCPLSDICTSSKVKGPAPNVVDLFPDNPKRKLYAEIAKREGSQSHHAYGVVSFNDPRVDACFAHGGLAKGRWHDIGGVGLEHETPASAAGFTARLASQAAGKGAIIWALKRDDLYAPGVGLDPDRLIYVRADKDDDILAIMESAARTPGVGAIIGEVASIDLTSGRRLQLACEARGATAFALRRRFKAPTREREEKHSLATTRWRVAPTPSDASLPGLGPARWEVHLERSRNGRPGAWIMEAHNASNEKESPIRVVAELADHAAETRARGEPPGWAAGSRDHDPGRQYAAFRRG